MRWKYSFNEFIHSKKMKINHSKKIFFQVKNGLSPRAIKECNLILGICCLSPSVVSSQRRIELLFQSCSKFRSILTLLSTAQRFLNFCPIWEMCTEKVQIHSSDLWQQGNYLFGLDFEASVSEATNGNCAKILRSRDCTGLCYTREWDAR